MINFLKTKYLTLKARNAYKAESFEKSIAYFEELWEFAPMEYDALITHILCHFSLEEYDSAIELLDQGLNVYKQDEDLLSIKANCFTSLNDFEKSFEITSQLIVINKEDEVYLTMHAYNLDKLDRYKESREIYLKITAPSFSPQDSNQLYPNTIDDGFQGSNNFMALNNFGYQRMKIGEFQEAIKNFDRAIEINEFYPYPYNNRGFAYLNLGELDKAIRDINYSIELDGDNSYAYKNRALYFLEINDKKEALANLKLAWALGFEEKYGEEVNILIKKIETELPPTPVTENKEKDEIALNNLGHQKMEIGEYKEAITYFNIAIEIDRTFASPYNNRGFAYLELGELEKAIQDINYSIELEEKNSYAYRNKGLYFLKLNNYKKALINLKIAQALGFEEEYEEELDAIIQEIEEILSTQNNLLDLPYKFIETDPYDVNNEIVINNLGYQKMEEGKFKEAIENFNKAIQIKTNFANPYNNRGFAYLKLGELEKAIEDIEYALKLDPKNSYGYKNRALYFIQINKKEEALVNLKVAQALGFEEQYGEEVNDLIKKIEGELLE